MRAAFVFSFFCLIFLCSCISPRSAFFAEQADYSIENPSVIKAEFFVVHADENRSWLYYQIPSSAISYQKKKKEDSLAVATLRIRIGSSPFTKSDSVYFIYDSVYKNFPHLLTGKLSVDAKEGVKKYRLLEMFDINSGKRDYRTIFLNKTSSGQTQNFLVSSPQRPFFSSPYFGSAAGVIISLPRNKTKKNLFVSKYTAYLAPAAPPFAENYVPSTYSTPDSVFTIDQSDSLTFNFRLDKPGVYLISQDNTRAGGLGLFYFNRGFPDQADLKQKAECMRYLLTGAEFDSLMSSGEIAKEMTNFWLKGTGNMTRMQEVSTAWFNRVVEANTFFSSDREGWKTDRGMIYLVFGKPAKVHFNGEEEVWFYGSSRTGVSLTFTFKKVQNVLSENVFVLERNGTYTRLWYKAVTDWREGRIHQIK